MVRKLLLALAVAAILALTLRAHLKFISPRLDVMHSWDEGYLSASAMRLVDGRMLPYVDSIDQRGPLLHLVLAVLAKVTPALTWWPARLGALACGLGVPLLLFVIGIFAGRWLAGAIAAVAYGAAVLVKLGPFDGLAYNGEALLNLFAFAGLACLLRALTPVERPPSRALLAAAGALVMMSALVKQPGAINVVPTGAWVLAAALGRRELARRQRLAIVGWFAAGVLAPLLLLFVRYAIAGELRALVYWMLVRPRIYMEPYSAAMRRNAHRVWLRDQRSMLLGLATLAIWAATWPLARTRRNGLSVAQLYDRQGLLLAVALGVPLATWMAHAPLREFPHYYLQAYPWNALLAGLFIEELWLLVPLRRLDTLFAMALLVPNLWWTGDNLERLQIPRYDLRDRSQWDACRFVRAHSTESDRLFVWGYRSELYTVCRRRPASRFVYTTMVAGYIEWFDRPQDEEERSAAPGARDALIADLEASKPPVLIDAGVSFGRKLARYPQLSRWVDAHYCIGDRNGEVDYYLRRNDDGSCPVSQPSG